MATPPTHPRLLIFVNNHFDPTWRRCWDRSFAFEGQTFVSYADLEATYMLDNLALAEAHPEYAFEAESAIVVRKFLARHPEQREALLALAREGRFAVTGAGEAIVDSNMVLGESLIRNYLIGLLWVEETFGQRTRLAVRYDAFGNSAQLPQILRGCEMAWVTGLSYTPATGIYWRGLDGSTVVHRTLPIAAVGGGNTKYPPCPACHGTREIGGIACDACDGRGIQLVERAWLPGPINDEALAQFGAALVPVTPEELLPNPELLAWASARGDRYDVAFALEEEAYPYIAPWIEGSDAAEPQDVHPSVELNPNNAGCWVTRIKTKQVCRRQEYALLVAETLAVMTSRLGQTYPAAALQEIWRQLCFTMFHDAITATHVDPAYTELQDTWDEIDAATASVRGQALAHLVAEAPGVVTAINPTAQSQTGVCTVTLEAAPLEPALQDASGTAIPLLDARRADDGATTLQFVATDVPGFGTRAYRVVSDGAATLTEVKPLDALTRDGTPRVVIENERFRIEADAEGLRTIHDRTLGEDVARAAGYRPAELILEHDEGSPWATLHPDQSRVGLAPYTRLLRIEQGPAFQRLRYSIVAPREAGLSGAALKGELTVTLVRGLARVAFHLDAHWDAFNTRLRLAMPVPFTGRHVYEIPYGILARDAYEPTFGRAGANGDWPAVNWAGVEGDTASVALINRGTPSYRIEAAGTDPSPSDVILLALLRSPVIPTYLHEPEFYTMTAWDGMRDAGDHAFDVALVAYAGTFAESSIVFDAEAYNAGLLAVSGTAHLPAMPWIEADAVRIASVKRAEADDAVILRLHEFRGRGGEATIHLPFPVAAVTRVNLLERGPASRPGGEPLLVEGGAVRLRMRPWEIATLRIEPHLTA